ncbi:MAG TPA: hypothetical protein H9674_06830 [Firmicutes bacterium]|nr:hypothetical protein [Bacillota bacterium]
MDDNMLRMQQEAAERVRQMQERARRFVNEEPPAPAPMDIPCPPEPSPKGKEELAPPPRRGSLLSNFGKDREQLFLLMLAVLLVKNDAPIELVLALLYLAM